MTISWIHLQIEGKKKFIDSQWQRVEERKKDIENWINYMWYYIISSMYVIKRNEQKNNEHIY